MWFSLFLLHIQHGASINDVNFPRKDPHKKESSMEKSDEVIAFTAELSADTSLVANMPILFDHIITNAGGLYFNNTGQFVCADDELYVFIWSTLKARDDDIPGMRCIAKLRSGGIDTKYGPKTNYYSEIASGATEMTTVLPRTTSPPTDVNIMSAP